MEQKEILELISRFEDSSLSLLEIEQDSFKLHLEKGVAATPIAAQAIQPVPAAQTVPQPANAAKVQQETSSYETIKSPIVGVYYAAPSPDASPYVSVGDKVAKGQVLCLVEAMKMMNELKAPADGIIKSIKGINGELVEFDQILFEVEPC